MSCSCYLTPNLILNSGKQDGWHWAGGSNDERAPLKPTNKEKAALKKAFPKHKKLKCLK